MTEYQIKLAKLYAELIGVNVEALLKDGEEFALVCTSVDIGRVIFDPFKGQSQLDAMHNFKVNVAHCKQLDCGTDGNGSYDLPYVHFLIDNKGVKKSHSVTPLNDDSAEAMGVAVIECILRSQGKL